MPFREAIIGDLRLTSVEGTLAAPVFVGDVEGRNLTVRFDYGALGKLAGSGELQAVQAILAEKREAIRAAAQNLLREGYWKEQEEGVEVACHRY